MQPIEIIVIIISVVIVVGVFVGGIIRKKKGKSSSCGCCADCPYSKQCSSKDKQENPDDKEH